MSRPKADVPLVKKIAQAFKAVGKLQRAGTNKTRRYKFTRATDVFEAVRLELFNRDVLCCPSEGKPEFVNLGPTNGGEQMTECRLAVTYIFRDAASELPPMTFNGVGRDVEDKAIYKAQTGAQKALMKRFGLMAEEADDPEWDDREAQTGETLDDVAPRRTPTKFKPIRDFEIQAFQEACANTSKTPDEISAYLAGTHKIAALPEMRRGDFKLAMRWASNGAGTLTPKPKAVPSQASLALRTATKPVELKIGNKTVEFEPSKTAYSV